MERFAKIVDFIRPLSVFSKHLILFVSQGYDCAFDKTKLNPSVISQKIRSAISANLFLN